MYICSPYSGEVEHNKQNACRFSRFAAMRGYIPVTPHDASGASGGVWLGKASGDSYYGYLGVTDSECTVYVDLNAGDIFSNGVQVKSTEDIKRNIAESGSALDAIRNSKIYTYNLISEPVTPCRCI